MPSHNPSRIYEVLRPLYIVTQCVSMVKIKPEKPPAARPVEGYVADESGA
jgi:hypothetical protein